MRRIVRYFLVIFLLCLSCSYLYAQEEVRLWGSEHTHYRSKSKLYIYPANGNSRTAIIICPGGSYCYLGMNVEGHNIARWLQSKGITAIVLRYRVNALFIRHPSMIQDLQKALIYARTHTDKLHCSTDRIGVMGFSAGGHLAGLANTYYDTDFTGGEAAQRQVSLRPSFVAMIYPVISMQDSIAHLRSKLNLIGHHPSKQLKHDMSLELNVHSGMSPVFLMNCRDDKTVKDANSVVYDNALTQHNIPHLYLHYSRGNHGFGLTPHKAQSDATDWGDKFIEWLKQIQ